MRHLRESTRGLLLRVELDDELLGERNIDLGALGQLVHEDAERGRDDLEPGRDRTLADGDTLRVGALELEVIGLRGHTDDGLALLLRTSGGTHLFSGDSLFPGGPGKTTSPEDFTRLMDDLEARVFGRLDDDVVVHPGHGDDTTLGAERPHLGEWRARGW